MQINTIWLLFLFVTIVDFFIGLAIFFSALFPFVRSYTVWHKVSLVSAAIGLTGGVINNLMFLITGTMSSNANVFFWACKDIGLLGISISYAMGLAKKRGGGTV